MELTSEISNKLACAFCAKIFSTSSSVQRHVRTVHKVANRKPTNIQCIDCQETQYFLSTSGLQNHLESNHGYEFKEENLTFSTMDDFLSWKVKIEKETNSRYISQATNKKDGKLFVCHRSGVTKYTGLGIRNPKWQGSCKIGYYCTSRIIMAKVEDKFFVKYIQKHYGHTNDKVHLRLHNDDKIVIASKVDDQNASVSSSSLDVESKDLLERKDVKSKTKFRNTVNDVIAATELLLATLKRNKDNYDDEMATKLFKAVTQVHRLYLTKNTCSKTKRKKRLKNSKNSRNNKNLH